MLPFQRYVYRDPVPRFSHVMKHDPVFWLKDVLCHLATLGSFGLGFVGVESFRDFFGHCIPVHAVRECVKSNKVQKEAVYCSANVVGAFCNGASCVG